jgi:hypothetical protein
VAARWDCSKSERRCIHACALRFATRSFRVRGTFRLVGGVLYEVIRRHRLGQLLVCQKISPVRRRTTLSVAQRHQVEATAAAPLHLSVASARIIPRNMSIRIRLCALYVAWMVAAFASAQAEPTKAINADRGSGICIRKDLPPHLWPHQYDQPTLVVGPLHEPHHPHVHGAEPIAYVLKADTGRYRHTGSDAGLTLTGRN